MVASGRGTVYQQFGPADALENCSGFALPSPDSPASEPERADAQRGPGALEHAGGRM